MVERSVNGTIASDAASQTPSFLAWVFIDVLGISGLMIAIAAVLSIVLTLILVRRGRGDLAGTALVLIVPFPLAVSLIGTLDALGVTCAGLGCGLELKDVADSLARALFCPMFGMICSSPAVMVAVWNSYWRSTTAVRTES
jgi:F0F1-type ATP synthase membrane subunit c/vacuolar-type H+-ATPase subunit K